MYDDVFMMPVTAFLGEFDIREARERVEEEEDEVAQPPQRNRAGRAGKVRIIVPPECHSITRVSASGC